MSAESLSRVLWGSVRMRNDAFAEPSRWTPTTSWLVVGLRVYETFWWTWSGSNRRPLPCHLRIIKHLQAFSPETKDLARGPVDSGGRHGVPFGRLDSTRTPGLHNWLARGVLSCARGCRLLYLLSAEGDNNQFPYKHDAHVELLARQLVRQPPAPGRLGACRPAGGVAGSILTSVPASSVCAGHGSRSKISPVPARPPTQIPSAVSKTSRTLHVRSLHSGGTIFYRRG